MQVNEEGGTLIVEDSPGLHWLPALLFIVVGSIFVIGSLGLSSSSAGAPWRGILVAAFGVLAVAAGLWTLVRSPRSRLTVDLSGARVKLERWGVGRRKVWEWPLASLMGVQLFESHDDEGGEVFQVHLLLREGEPVPVSPVWRHGRAPMTEAGRRIAAAAKVRFVDVRPWSA